MTKELVLQLIQRYPTTHQTSWISDKKHLATCIGYLKTDTEFQKLKAARRIRRLGITMVAPYNVKVLVFQCESGEEFQYLPKSIERNRLLKSGWLPEFIDMINSGEIFYEAPRRRREC